MSEFVGRNVQPFVAQAPAAPPGVIGEQRSGLYLPVRWKFGIATTAGLLWAAFALLGARLWIEELSGVTGPVLAHIVIFGIAVMPGFMNAFLIVSLALDRRPGLRSTAQSLPGLTILVAAYNEQDSIASTVESIARQNYPGALQVVVINDGSTDATAARLAALDYPWLEVLNLERNGGKARALNLGLERARFRLTLTVDGDSCLYRNALRNLVGRYLSDPGSTKAVAGAVLVRNSRSKLLTRAQEWDYFHGIAAIKRVQSLYHGTLVAQGAFSLYETELLRRLGGWPETVGEDIVLTWRILEQGHRVGYAENACLFTNAPDTWRQFIRQRQRWSRGLIEAFKAHWRLLFRLEMRTMFIWWNLFFPYLDLVYTFAFLPGLLLACFGIYWIAGPMTLLVLPLAMVVNAVMYRVQSRMFEQQGLKVRRNRVGFVFYALFYSLVLQPACVVGYMEEILNRRKRWGTK
ncbi:glycosyltransferase [Caldimonas tepidiphila]|uniref:glycosyltransferase n=1 Tax=Caldimonas tepidiphila TaxID=2315841 RepID=UPI00196AE853|nr:glycosyltransferase [Caldimonas tepidiphila]